MYYQEMVSEVPEPWRQFLRKTSLLPGTNNIVILVVPAHEESMYSSLELLSKVYAIAKQLYPDMLSLAIAHGDEYDLIKDGTLELVDIRYL